MRVNVRRKRSVLCSGSAASSPAAGIATVLVADVTSGGLVGSFVYWKGRFRVWRKGMSNCEHDLKSVISAMKIGSRTSVGEVRAFSIAAFGSESSSTTHLGSLKKS